MGIGTCPLCGGDIPVTPGGRRHLATHLPDCPAGDEWRPGEPWPEVRRRLP